VSRWHLVDTHCHIDTPAFDDDRQSVIERAFEARIALINSGISLKSNWATRELLQHENVYAAYGLSPLHVAEKENVEEFIRQNADSATAVGEVGLDYYHVKSGHQREQQEKAFGRFIQLSQELGLPLVIHSRNAEERVFELVHGVDQAVYHCYGGSVELLEKIVDCGHFVSISTKVCQSGHHQKLVEKAPRDMVVIETDSPYLAARKGRNEPSFVGDAIVAISRIWDTEVEDAASIIAENTCRAFNLG
jgi:TatD DNase family protein